MFKHLYGIYDRVMRQEAAIAANGWNYPDAENMCGEALQILECAKSNLVLRYYTVNYGLIDKNLVPTPEDALTSAHESVGGHTNLVRTISRHALRYKYGPRWLRTEDGYSPDEVDEALSRHDLPEVVTGDTADNGNRNEAAKLAREGKYQKWYSQLAPAEKKYERSIHRIIAGMNDRSGATGRHALCCDKAALLVQALCYEQADLSLLRFRDDPELTQRDIAEMELCDETTDTGACFASEMWTIDFLKFRNFAKCDDTGFITGLVVMTTLIVKGRWYSWRKQDYKLL